MVLNPMDAGNIAISVNRGNRFRGLLLSSLESINGRWQNPVSGCVVYGDSVFYPPADPTGRVGYQNPAPGCVDVGGIIFYKHAVLTKRIKWERRRF